MHLLLSPEEFYDSTPEAKVIHSEAEKCMDCLTRCITRIQLRKSSRVCQRSERLLMQLGRDLADDVYAYSQPCKYLLLLASPGPVLGGEAGVAFQTSSAWYQHAL